MLYSSVEFFIFFIFVFTLYTLNTDRNRRFYILLLSSLFFYAWAGFLDLLIFVFVVLISWLCVYAALKHKKHKNYFIGFGIVVMTLHLFIWKYFSWFLGEFGAKSFNLPLPIGISFFTLQGIAYLVDFSRNNAKYIDFKTFLLFKSFFPQLVAGPIVRAKQILSSIETLPRATYVMMTEGLALFCVGFFKKMFIADVLAKPVDQVFLNPSAYDRISLLVGALSYTIQIWADFSGYTDMGRGCAKMLGIELPENFKSPYLARSPSEFWRRWHITLSEWIRDYIYIPLGGNKGSLVRALIVVLVTMSVSGLWHGANWTFLAWGLYHGLLIVGERLSKNVNKSFSSPPILQMSFMFCLTVLGWLIFRSSSFSLFCDYFVKIVGGGVSTKAVEISWTHFRFSVAFCLFYQIAFYYNFESKKYVYQYLTDLKWFQSLRRNVQKKPKWILVSGACLGFSCSSLLFLSIFMRPNYLAKAFIYFQF